MLFKKAGWGTALHLEPGEKILLTTASAISEQFGIDRLADNGQEEWSSRVPVGSAAFASTLLRRDESLTIAGSAAPVANDNYDLGFVRYLPSGELDSTFGYQNGKAVMSLGDPADKPATVAEVDVPVEGKRILVVGTRVNEGYPSEGMLVRYDLQGKRDERFGHAGKLTSVFDSTKAAAFRALAHQRDGKILIAGGDGRDFGLVRYEPNGDLDQSFGTGGKLTTDVTPYGGELATGVVVMPDGGIVASGRFETALPCYDGCLALAGYTSSGVVDTAFGNRGTYLLTTQSFDPIGSALDPSTPEGRIVVVGTVYSNMGGTSVIGVARFERDGSLDPSFGGDGIVEFSANGSLPTPSAVAVRPDGNVIVVATGAMPSRKLHVTRFSASGAVLGRFVSTRVSYGGGISLLTDGRFAVTAWDPEGSEPAVYMFTEQGTLDDAFGVSGRAETKLGVASYPRCVLGLSNGNFVVAGTTAAYLDPNAEFGIRNDDVGLVVLGATGAIEHATTTSLGEVQETVSALLPQAEGKMLFAGTRCDVAGGMRCDGYFARLTKEGWLDRWFGRDLRLFKAAGQGQARAMVEMADGEFLIGGGDGEQFALSRHDVGYGALRWSVRSDISAGPDVIKGLALTSKQSDQRILAIGEVRCGELSCLAIVRYHANGTIDTDFGTAGKVISDRLVPEGVVLQADGRIVVAGVSVGGGFMLARFWPDGRLDESFGAGGPTPGSVEVDFGRGPTRAQTIVLDEQGRIVVAGGVGSGPEESVALARLWP